MEIRVLPQREFTINLSFISKLIILLVKEGNIYFSNLITVIINIVEHYIFIFFSF